MGDSENQKLRDNVVGSNEIENYARLLANSFYKETGQNLVEQKENIAQQIWDADYGLLAHSTNVEPYVFVYANQTAFKEFRCTWDEIIGKPSYTSADEAGQTDRYKFIEEAFKNGYAVRYNIKRTSPATGAYVTIENSLLFNVKDANGHIVGQAAKLEGFKK